MELIAKRYVQSLAEILDTASLQNASELFEVLSSAFEEKKFQHIMQTTDVAASAKTALVLDMVKSANSTEINNLIKLLGENGRLSLIPALSQELKKTIAEKTRVFSGRVYSDSALDQSTIDTLARDLGKKTGSTISLQFVPSDFDGVRVEVDTLNVEINFSKNRLNAQLIEHILKAI